MKLLLLLLTLLVATPTLSAKDQFIKCGKIKMGQMCGWDAGQSINGDVLGNQKIINFVNSYRISSGMQALEMLAYDNNEIAKAFRFIESNNNYRAQTGSHYGVLQWGDREAKKMIKLVHSDKRFRHLKGYVWGRTNTNARLQDAMVTISIEYYRSLDFIAGQPMFDAYIRHLMGEDGAQIFCATFFGNHALRDVQTNSGVIRKSTILKRVFTNLGPKGQRQFGYRVKLRNGRFGYRAKPTMSISEQKKMFDALFKRIIVKLAMVA